MTEDTGNRHRYDDMLYLPHHVSRTHPQMPMRNRAAQFAPFAALTGYEDAIRETDRLTEERIELDENSKEILDEKLRRLQMQLSDIPEVAVTYFQPDDKKAGGTYVTDTFHVRRIDGIRRVLVMQEDVEIKIDDMIQLDW